MTGAGPFGKLLRAHRLAAGLTQVELATRAGLSAGSVKDLERGVRHRPQPSTAHRLADALGLTANDRAELLAGIQSGAASDDLQSEQSTSSPLSTLPVRLTSFVGREQEVPELCQLLDTARLLTLVGTGGIGKTRLALEVAERRADAYSGGVILVDLAPLGQPELVAQSLAQALGLRTELDRQPLAAVLTVLAARQLLLIFDNCEHLIDACAELVPAVLGRCPLVRVVVTSREPLGVPGETVYRLRPLAETAAVRLFVERAQAQRGDLTADDTSSVVEVCKALDHLPLAIELAAARTGVLRPAELLPRLEDRFAVLKRVGWRGGLPRQQTLLATVDWSYGLLEGAEQELFRRLAVFASAFDLAGAIALGGPAALDILERLVDKSLVMAQAYEHGTRYRLLDTMRQYAWIRLQEAGEVDFARQRHLEQLLGRAEALFSPSDSLDGPTRELDGRLDDLRGALEWSLFADPAAGLRLVAATRDVWWRQSWAEGRRWASAFLEQCPEPSVARARVLQTAGLLEAVGDPVNAYGPLLEARELAVRLGDDATVGMIEAYLGLAEFMAERAPEAIHYLENSVASFKAAGRPRGEGMTLPILGWALLTDRARREEGRALLEHVHEFGEQWTDRYVMGMADYGLGLYWRWSTRPDLALIHFRRALTELRGLDVAPDLSATLLHMARLLVRGEPVVAARLASGARAAAERVGVHLAPRLLLAVDELRSEVNQRLGAEAARLAWAEGERLALGEAVDLALASPADPARFASDGLTAREQEISSLIADGLSNREIAEKLVISEGTVDVHVKHVLGKLGFRSRAQVAGWFARQHSPP
jgi:non-specific serine/threonine protein kinase